MKLDYAKDVECKIQSKVEELNIALRSASLMGLVIEVDVIKYNVISVLQHIPEIRALVKIKPSDIE